MLDPAWRWLHREKGPKLLLAALADAGVKETPGKPSNPIILQWAKELGIASYTNDGTPWCGLALAHWCHVAGYTWPQLALRARAWAGWGNPAPVPMLADVLVFERGGAGHVGLYIGEDDTSYAVLGGNQADQVNISWLAKDRLLEARRSPWKIAQPSNVRVVRLTRSGNLSVNEA
jgi:uncharacterized protein (TIGR02594 family)